VHTPKTKLIFASVVGHAQGYNPAQSNETYVADIDDQTGTISNVRVVMFDDGFSGSCNLYSASADEFMCFDGSLNRIRVYDTSLGSNVVSFNRFVIPSLYSFDTCSHNCYQGTFAWDGMYFYFAHKGDGYGDLNYIVLEADGSYYGEFTATGSGALSGAYFDWSAGRYSSHDGWGRRAGATNIFPSNMNGQDDTHSFSYFSPAHSY